MDIRRQFTHRDRDGEYAGMSHVSLSVGAGTDAGYVTLGAEPGPDPPPRSSRSSATNGWEGPRRGARPPRRPPCSLRRSGP
jgi:hypothetical protein